MSNHTDGELRFNPNDARTWDDKQQQVYETGHREGESCEGASWTFMLDDAFGIEAHTPEEAKQAFIAQQQALIDRICQKISDDLEPDLFGHDFERLQQVLSDIKQSLELEGE